MNKAVFSKEGHFWVSFIQNKETGRWVHAFTAKDAKAIFAIQEGVNMSSYIVSSKKGYTE